LNVAAERAMSVFLTIPVTPDVFPVTAEIFSGFEREFSSQEIDLDNFFVEIEKIFPYFSRSSGKNGAAKETGCIKLCL
jgi:hypothetical protein